MKNSIYLKKVKKLYLSHYSEFLCICIAGANENIAQTRNIEQWVYKMLGGRATYEIWLTNNGIDWDDIHKNQDKVRQGRLAWLDWMIAYCEKEEAEQTK